MKTMKELLQEAKGKKFATGASILKNIISGIKTSKYIKHSDVLKSLKKEMLLRRTFDEDAFDNKEISWKDFSHFILEKDPAFKNSGLVDTNFKSYFKSLMDVK